ncbi:MAG TPA: hypothetical protein GXX14_00365 [Clostridiaceae bacterium]|nr:hypothetical protein [Clostridiaceae bacterium]
MTTLIVNYNELNNLTGTAKSLSKKLASRIDDYSNIRKKLDSISGGNNINQANYFIQKKNEKLQEKKDNIDAFIKRVSDFREEAKETDKRVARRISSDTYTFRKVNNISVSFFSCMALGLEEMARFWFGRDAVNIAKTMGRNIKYAIKDWYHDRGGKYYVNIAKDLALLGLAVAAIFVFPASSVKLLPILAHYFFGIFSIVDSGATLWYDFKALSEFNRTKNRAVADRIDEMGGDEAAEEIAVNWFNKDAKTGRIFYNALSLASIAYAFGKDFKSAKNLIGNFKTMKGSFASRTIKAYKESGFVTDAVTIRKGGERIQKLNKLNKVLKSFNISEKTAMNIAKTLALYEDIKTARDLVDYVDVIGKDGDKWKIKLPTVMEKTIEHTSELLVDTGVVPTENKQATRMPQLKKIEALKVPVMCTP